MVLVILDASMRILLLLRDASEQHQEDPIRFINWSSSRCVQSNDFRAPFRDWWCWPLTISRLYTYVRQRGFLLLPATMAHTLHPLTPLFLSSTLLTVYMEMRLSLQKLLFADIPFVRSFVVGCCSMMNQRGGDDDMTQISESSQLFPWSSLYVLVSTAIAAAKKSTECSRLFGEIWPS